MEEREVEDPGELLRLKGEILSMWQRLPAEHQATMLLVLLDRSEWADWVLEAKRLLERRTQDDR